MGPKARCAPGGASLMYQGHLTSRVTTGWVIAFLPSLWKNEDFEKVLRLAIILTVPKLKFEHEEMSRTVKKPRTTTTFNVLLHLYEKIVTKRKIKWSKSTGITIRASAASWHLIERLSVPWWFPYQIILFNVFAHGNSQLVWNSACAVLVLTSGTCVIEAKLMRLQNNAKIKHRWMWKLKK